MDRHVRSPVLRRRAPVPTPQRTMMRIKVSSARAGSAAFLLLWTATALQAQTPVTIGESAPLSSRSGDPIVQQPAGPAPTPAHTGIKAMIVDLAKDVTHLPSRENLLWAGVGGGLAAAVHPLDDNVNEALIDNSTAENIFKP